MKVYVKIITVVTASAFLCPLFSIAADLGSLDSTVQILQEQIARQIERIQAARQKADIHMNLASARVEQQLGVAQQELAVQVEKLQQLRAQLQDRTRETEEKITYWQTQGAALIGKTLSEVSSQISETTQLIQNLDELKRRVNCNCPNQKGLEQGLPSPQSTKVSVPDSLVADATPSPSQDMAMLTFPEAEPLTFALPLGPAG